VVGAVAAAVVMDMMAVGGAGGVMAVVAWTGVAVAAMDVVAVGDVGGVMAVAV
jgi:hypothetical protein